MIFWNKHNPKKRLVEVMKVTVKPKMVLKDHVEPMLASVQDEKERQQLRYMMNNLVAAIDMKRTVDSITIGECVKFDKNAKAAVARLVKFVATGDAGPSHNRTPPSKNGNGLPIRFRTASVDLLQKLIPLHGGGRFYPLKLEVKRQIQLLAPDQMGVIEPIGDLKTNEKERGSFMQSVKKMFGDDSLPWVITWTPVENVFLLVRRAQWEAVKPTNKKKGSK